MKSWTGCWYWEHNYPLSTVDPRDRNISDHTPLILNTGASTHQNRQPTFKFEMGWLTRDGFFDMVADICQSECRSYSTLERWQNKIRNLRQYLRGWAKHTAGIYRKENKSLSSLIDRLDKKVKTSILSDNEINMKHCLKERLATLLREEEIKWYERAKVQNLLQEDDNARFFHLIASNKH
jgi:predicted secreted Zn-dependent protease